MRIINIDAYDGIRQVFKDYWTAYGGWRALFHSGYFHLAIILTVCLSPRWLSADWPDDVIDVIPSVLGFSLGGYAMLLAFGDRSFLRMLSEPVEPNKASYFVELNASFVHFIILQTITIFLALIGKAYVSSSASPLQLAFAALSYMLFLYSLSAALAATMAIFRVATLYAEVAALSKKSDRDCRGLRGPDQDS